MNRKQAALVLAGVLLVVSLWALSGALGQLSFREGRLPDSVFGSAGAPSASAEPQGAPGWMQLVFVFVTWVLLPASIVMVLIDPRSLKLVLMRALAISLWLFALWSLMQIIPLFGWLDLGGEAEQEAGGAAATVDPLPDAGAVPLPPWSGWLAGFLLAGGALWLARRLWRAWGALRPEPEEDLSEELARAAVRASQDLERGVPLRGVVLRCYARMCALLGGRHTARLPTLTPREFEANLRRAGVFDPSIARLSRLFERVRYGHGPATAEDEREAQTCLAQIERRFRGSA